ncbi:MAG: hypothetical protein AAGE92_09005 [Cyanobacteria bacterium P01_G01_bin.4]
MLNYDEIFVSDGTNTNQPKVVIRPPTEDEKGDFSCEVELNGFGQSLRKSYFGVTKAQSLSIAIRTVNFLILNSAEYLRGQVFCRLTDGTTERLTPEMLGEQTHLEQGSL